MSEVGRWGSRCSVPGVFPFSDCPLPPAPPASPRAVFHLEAAAAPPAPSLPAPLAPHAPPPVIHTPPTTPLPGPGSGVAVYASCNVCLMSAGGSER